MSPEKFTPRASPTLVRRACVVTAGTLSITLALTGCLGSVGKAINAVHAAVNAVGDLKNLQKEIKKGENIKYEATYESIGSGSSSSPITTFAQAPGGKYDYLLPASSGSEGTDFVADGKNTYACSQQSSGAKWSCIKSAEPSAGGISGDPFYAFTGAYSVALIEALSVAAAFSGLKQTNSTTSVSGISLKCTTIRGKANGQTDNYEWCITGDGILGMVKNLSSDASSNSSFQITSLTHSPSSSVFEAPQGATITPASSTSST
jgi:hypothetical protein